MSNQEYNLGRFIEDETTQKKGMIVFDENHKYLIKDQAWTYLKLGFIYQKYSQNPAIFGIEIVKTFLGEEALKYINQNISEVGKAEIITTIINHLSQKNKPKTTDIKK